MKSARHTGRRKERHQRGIVAGVRGWGLADVSVQIDAYHHQLVSRIGGQDRVAPAPP